MAVTNIGTYAGLLSSAADWLNRADLTDLVPNFVTLAEAQFNRQLRVRDMQVRAEATSILEFLPLPADFLEAYSLTLNSTDAAPRWPLKYISKKEADATKSYQQTGPVESYTILDGAFELIPAPPGSVDLILTYYAKIPALSTVLQTNWLITKSPDLYLASTILQAAPYLNDQVRLQTWSAIRSEIMGGMALESERAMRPTTQLIARVPSF